MPDGGKITVIDGGMIARATGAVRNFIAGVNTAWFGPGQPLAPMAPPGTGGRAFDYNFGTNIQYIPRSSENIGFYELRALADALPLLRVAIETRKDQIQGADWTIRKRDKKSRKVNDADPRIEEIKNFLQRPDREHDFSTWIRALMEEMLVTDAASIYPRLTRGGDVYSLDLIDGTTINRLIDDTGRTPEAPNPAYQQILHGVVAADFSRDDLIYVPRNVRVNKLYGYSPVEQIILTVNIALRRELFTLDYYKAGSIPDAIASLPKEWNTDQVKAFQEYWDFLLSGNSAEKRKMRFVPGGQDFNLNQLKQPPLKDMYDEWLARVICWALNVSVSSLVSQVNRATGETLRITANEEGLQPTLLWTTNLLNLIITKYFNAPDLEFAWENKDKGDAFKQSQADDIDFKNGTKTLDEIREARGDEPMGINYPVIVTSSGPLPLKEALDAAREDLLNPPEPPPQLVGANNGILPEAGADDGSGKRVDPSASDDVGNKEVGEKADTPFQKRARKRVLPGLNYERRLLRRVRKGLAKDLAHGLREIGKDVSAQVRKDLGKAGNNRTKAQKMAKSLDLSAFDILIEPTEKALRKIARDAGEKVLTQFGIEDDDDLFNRVNQRAADWAKERAAEMVGRSYDDDGELLEAARAQYRLDDLTRERLQETIYEALEEGKSVDELVEDLMDSYAFSEERAEAIARTELTRANNEASLMAAQEARDDLGLGVKKVWLTDDDPCPVCEDNADEGPIDLDDDFPSGDAAPPGHPNCQCTLIYEVDENE